MAGSADLLKKYIYKKPATFFFFLSNTFYLLKQRLVFTDDPGDVFIIFLFQVLEHLPPLFCLFKKRIAV